jgi:hypothetical protein
MDSACNSAVGISDDISPIPVFYVECPVSWRNNSKRATESFDKVVADLLPERT